MEVKQIYELVNAVTGEIIGESAVLNEDLSNVVEIGESIFNANAVDAYVKSLVNHIGKVIFVNRSYKGGAPSVLMDGWEFGSVLEKISGDLLDAQENESWELEDGASYDPNIFYAPKIEAKFFNKKVTFEIPISFVEKQVKQSFSNAQQLNAFLSMIYNKVEQSMTVKLDALIMRTINNFTASTVHDAFGGATITGAGNTRAVNLLKRYNDETGEALTATDCLKDKEFIRYATYHIGLYVDRMQKMSTLFNMGGKDRFTPSDMLHIVLLSEFANSAKVYLSADTYHKELVALPNYEVVAYWQGTGTDYAFGSTSKIDVKTASGDTQVVTGVLGVMFDRDALGVCNRDRRVTTNYNPKGEFYTNFNKFDAEYFNDFNENFVVFYVA